jgi:hypothetical protein
MKGRNKNQREAGNRLPFSFALSASIRVNPWPVFSATIPP